MFVRVLVLTLAACSTHADEVNIPARALEGAYVVMKIEMPATSMGVDIYADSDSPLDYPRHGERLRRFGLAIKVGDRVMITQVKQKDNVVEVHLGGGGHKWGMGYTRIQQEASRLAGSRFNVRFKQKPLEPINPDVIRRVLAPYAELESPVKSQPEAGTESRKPEATSKNDHPPSLPIKKGMAANEVIAIWGASSHPRVEKLGSDSYILRINTGEYSIEILIVNELVARYTITSR